ncbi:hypothetical protein AB0L63_29935 [Nocardia sp. NPDC051990]|uniref:hypothetical protein n=1 Tax=Nocardia sp. NPDC051990 TaxID=3155285 RepID=UPI003447B4D7
MTNTWTITPAGSDFDRAGQNVPVRDSDRDIGLDTTTLHPLAEAVRAAFDTAELTDRIDQAWITPLDLDDDYDFSSRRFRGPATGWITRLDLADGYDRATAD